MVLPSSAHAKATSPLSDVLSHLIQFRADHTVPIRRANWDLHSRSVIESIRHIADALDLTPGEDESFESIRTWAQGIATAYARTLTTLMALSPFAPFDHELAVELQKALREDIGTAQSAAGCQPRAEARGGKLKEFADRWSGTTWPAVESSSLQMAFEVTTEPVDSNGDFQAAAIFSAYRYENRRLMTALVPHLKSLGVPEIPDVLVCVSIVGWIVTAEDPILAHMAFHDLLTALLGADNQKIRDDALAHFRDNEGPMRQTRARIHSTLNRVDADDREAFALAAADVYKRVVESGVRQYGWALVCLSDGKWALPKTLTPVRQRMVAMGGFAKGIAQQCVLTDLRNGEAHENLEWDGIADHFRVGENSIELAQVVGAIASGMSFELGCASAIACLRAQYLVDEPETPNSTEKYRMPAWHRAESYFGTNGLILDKADFNRSPAKIVLKSFDAGDVNPCFQALMVARQLMPRPVSFEVWLRGREDPIIHLEAKVLDESYALWNEALKTFTAMPFSAFLPVNLAARRYTESASTALRSICWIASDDILDAFDSSWPTSGYWSSSVLLLFQKRLGFVRQALGCCCKLPDVDGDGRIRALIEAIDSVAEEIVDRQNALHEVNPSLLNTIERIRYLWTIWGPVPRLPGVPDESTRVDVWPSGLKPPRDTGNLNSI